MFMCTHERVCMRMHVFMYMQECVYIYIYIYIIYFAIFMNKKSLISVRELIYLIWKTVSKDAYWSL